MNNFTRKQGERLKFVFSPDIILCGGLGSKHQLTNCNHKTEVGGGVGLEMVTERSETLIPDPPDDQNLKLEGLFICVVTQKNPS